MNQLPSVSDFFSAFERDLKKQTIFFIFDFDGTLADITNNPEDTSLPRTTIENLHKLDQLSQGRVLILSGRPLSFLQNMFAKTSLKIVGEHGAETNFKNATNSLNLEVDFPLALKRFLFQLTEKFPRSFIESKKHSLVWHYRSELQHNPPDIERITETARTHICDCDLVCRNFRAALEIQSIGISKKIYMEKFSENFKEEHFLLFGDDFAERDIFQALGAKRSSLVGVGARLSADSTFTCSSPKSLRNWLNQFVSYWHSYYHENPQKFKLSGQVSS